MYVVHIKVIESNKINYFNIPSSNMVILIVKISTTIEIVFYLRNS